MLQAWDAEGASAPRDSIRQMFRAMSSTIGGETGAASVQTMEMQKKHLLKIQQETSQEKEDVQIETLRIRHAKTKVEHRSVGMLRERGEREMLELEDLYLDEKKLEKKIDDIREDIVSLQSMEGGRYGAETRRRKLLSDIQSHDNRIDKALVKVNEVQAKNRNLKLTLENMHKDRSVLDEIFRNVQGELEKKKIQITATVKLTSATYMSKRSACFELAELRRTVEREYEAFEREWVKMGSMIETEIKAIDYGQQSVVKNSNTIAAERRRRHLQYLQEKNEVARKEHIQQMKLSRAQWQFATDRAHILSCSQRIQDVSANLETIKCTTRIDSPEELAQYFVAAEAANFSSFNLVNKLGKEEESLQMELSKLYRDSTLCEQENLRDHVDVRSEMNNNLERNKQRMKAFERRLACLHADVASMQDPLQNLLKMLDLSPAQLEIYMEQSVNDGNVLDFLDLVEKRTRFFIEQYLDVNNRRPTELIECGHDETILQDQVIDIVPPSSTRASQPSLAFDLSLHRAPIHDDRDILLKQDSDTLRILSLDDDDDEELNGFGDDFEGEEDESDASSDYGFNARTHRTEFKHYIEDKSPETRSASASRTRLLKRPSSSGKRQGHHPSRRQLRSATR